MSPLLLKFPGLSGKSVAVDRLNVLYLEEADVNGTPTTNLHFTNGRWVTLALELDEVALALEAASDVKPETQEQKSARWREEMRIRREAQLEVDAAIKTSSLDRGDYRVCRHHVETQPDGTKQITVVIEPKATTRVEP